MFVPGFVCNILLIYHGLIRYYVLGFTCCYILDNTNLYKKHLDFLSICNKMRPSKIIGLVKHHFCRTNRGYNSVFKCSRWGWLRKALKIVRWLYLSTDRVILFKKCYDTETKNYLVNPTDSETKLPNWIVDGPSCRRVYCSTLGLVQ